jgi:hypothetical protein
LTVNAAISIATDSTTPVMNSLDTRPIRRLPVCLRGLGRGRMLWKLQAC